jgi:hypothetical protein
MQPLFTPRAVPLFDQRRTDPLSRPTSHPTSRAAAVKSLPSGCDSRGGRQAGALPRALDGRKLGGIPFGVGTALQSSAE